jgi:hypothetical protein
MLYPNFRMTHEKYFSHIIKIFSLSIHPIIERLWSHLNVWYLDDGTLGGSVESVLKDLEPIIVEFENLGPSLDWIYLYLVRRYLQRQYRFFLKNFCKIRLISEKYRKHKISYSFISLLSLLESQKLL